MKITNAVLVICHALCPGPGPAIFDCPASVTLAALFMYASMSPTRCSSVGSAGFAAATAVSAAAGAAASCAVKL